jgi:hypothetical protein
MPDLSLQRIDGSVYREFPVSGKAGSPILFIRTVPFAGRYFCDIFLRFFVGRMKEELVIRICGKRSPFRPDIAVIPELCKINLIGNSCVPVGKQLFVFIVMPQ